MPYSINPDRAIPWNNLPELPIDAELYRTIEIYEQLANARAALGRLQGRSAVIPNQGLLINVVLRHLIGQKQTQSLKEI